jgi:hypothetical protein
MSTTLEPDGENVPEDAAFDLYDEDGPSVTLEYDLDEPSGAAPETGEDAAEAQIQEPTVEPVDAASELPAPPPLSPSPLHLLPEPAASDGDAETSVLRRAAALDLPVPPLFGFTDPGLRSVPATRPLALQPSHHTALLPAPAPLPPAPRAPGSDELSFDTAALPVASSADSSHAEPGPAPSAPETFAEPDLLPLTLEELAPQLPEPPLLLFAQAPEPPKLPLTWTRPTSPPPESASAVFASALAAIVSARVVTAPLPVVHPPAPRTPAPSTPLPSRTSVPRQRRLNERRSVPARARRAKSRRRSRLGAAIKLALFAIELSLALILAMYAGVIPLLPPMPPAAHIITAGSSMAVQAQENLYCWFTPGRGRCSAPPSVPTQALPKVSVHRNSVLQFTFNYPAPTACAASILDSASSTGAMKPLGTLNAQGDAMMLAPRTFRLQVALAPGTYSLDVSCRWHPPQSLRWVQGQGESSYWVALSVLPS